MAACHTHTFLYPFQGSCRVVAEQRFVTYFRVSTDRQGRSGLGLDAQREAVRQFLTGRSAVIVSEFVEVESGGNDDRPKLKEALVACRRGKATLLIAKLDRLARSVAFIANLMDGNTDFVACDMPHASRLILHVMAAFAEHERQIIGERTKAALAAAKARGVHLGVNGHRLAAQNKADATAFAVTISHAINEARNAGALTTREIADHLNTANIPCRRPGSWHPTSVTRVLRRLDQ